MLADASAVGSGCLVESNGVSAVLVLSIANGAPQLHADLGGHRDKPSRKVGHLLIGERSGEGIDTLFITGGLAREETRTTDQPDAEALKAYIDKEKVAPTYSIGQLR